MPSSDALEPLFRPITLNALTIPNRLAMAPMTRSHSPGHAPTENVAAYYRRRAEGGTGLIVTEGVGIDHPASIGEGSGSGAAVPVLYGEAAQAGWRRVVDAVHEAGGAIFPQLWHQGPFRLEGTGPFPGAPTLTPSGTWGPMGGKSTVHPQHLDAYSKPMRAMTEEDIADVVAAFARSAAAAKAIGFDGIAIHGASGYLIDSFLWSKTNLRADRYGGDPAKRAEFAAEVVRAIRQAVGPAMPILFRFGQWKQQDFTAQIAENPDELGALLGPIADAGADMLDASALYFSKPAFEGSDLSLAAWAKKLTGKPSMAVGGVGLSDTLYSSLSTGGAKVEKNYFEAAERIAKGEFNMLALGRALIADPAWAAKIRTGEEPNAFRRDMLAELN